MNLRPWKRLREAREESLAAIDALMQDKADLDQEYVEAFHHLSNVLSEFYKTWERHEGKNKPSRNIHQANEFVFNRDGGALGAELKERKVVKKALIWEQGKGICYLCNRPLDSKKWTIDHVIPVSKGGGESLKNLMPTHRACNELKADSIVNAGDVYRGLPGA